MVSTFTQLLSTDVAPIFLAASATASVAYSYRYSLARYGLLGYSYMKQALHTKPLEVPVLNSEPCVSGTDTDTDVTVRLFPHIEAVEFTYDEATTTEIRPTEAQEEALRTAIHQWRARPVDNVCQHVSLYDALQAACARHPMWATSAFPVTIQITCDMLLMELTHTSPVVQMSEDDGTIVCLARGQTNTLCWPPTGLITPPSPSHSTA